MKLRVAVTLVAANAVLAFHPAVSHASSAAVAVMPFRDLSGGKGSVGEAIRETVTTDLKEVAGLRVIERANLDKVLSEQNLQGQKTDLDPTTTVKVGKLVGATLMVAGAYQKSGSNVRLTARFVSVETGEITGTAKVDGPQADFLSLQDKVTSQLLHSAGMEPKKVQMFAARKRPKVKSMKTIELYGDAVTETNDARKKELLQEAVKIDPTFVYASRDLDALEKRIREYGAIAEEAQTAELKAEIAKIDGEIKAEKDPMKLYMYYTQLFSKLLMSGRYKTLIAVCRRVLANPPPNPPQMGTAPSLAEMAQMWLVQSYEALKDDDGTLREGEKFMAKYPTSMYFSSIQMRINVVIDRKRDKESAGTKVLEEISQMGARGKDPCATGPVYKSNNMLPQAKRDLEQCVKNGGDKHTPWLAPFLLVFVNYDMGKFKEARRWIETIRTTYPDQYRNVRHLDSMMPKEE